MNKVLSILLDEESFQIASVDSNEALTTAIRDCRRQACPRLLVVDQSRIDNMPEDLRLMVHRESREFSSGFSTAVWGGLQGGGKDSLKPGFPFYDVRTLLKLISGAVEASAEGLLAYPQAMGILKELLTHRFLPLIRINKPFFKNVYVRGIYEIPKLLNQSPQRIGYSSEKAAKEIIDAIDSNNHEALVSIIQDVEYSALKPGGRAVPECDAASALEARRFFENTLKLITLLRDLLSGNDENRTRALEEFPVESALNFWLSWQMWKALGFESEYQAFFANTFYKESFFIASLALGDSNTLALSKDLTTRLDAMSWNDALDKLERKFADVKKILVKCNNKS